MGYGLDWRMMTMGLSIRMCSVTRVQPVSGSFGSSIVASKLDTSEHIIICLLVHSPNVEYTAHNGQCARNISSSSANSPPSLSRRPYN
jgi:hypothetical protein